MITCRWTAPRSGHAPPTVLSWVRGAGLSLACVAACIGCGGSDAHLARVTGRVTFYGRPARAEVVFQPVTESQFPAGRPSSAFTDDRGEFRLGYAAGEQGAVIGRQRVIVKVLPQADLGEPSSIEEASQPRKVVRLNRLVNPGRNRFDFALSY